MLLVLYIFLFVTRVIFAAENLYDYLQVSKSATFKEIKSAYRRETLKWHPDKNPSVVTNAKFIEIRKAYEILSHPDKRRRYDAYGYVDDYLNYAPFTPGLFENVMGNFFFPFDRLTLDENIVEITYQTYRVNYLPASRTVPLVFLGVSSFCFACRQVQPLWSKLATEYSRLGIRFGVGNLQTDAALREELNLLHMPCLVFIVDEQISYFTGTNFHEDMIVDFLIQTLVDSSSSRTAPIPGMLSTSLGSPLFTFFINEVDVDYFLTGWLEDSRPRAVFFKDAEKPPLRFCLAAFRSADFYATAFIDTRMRAIKPVLQRLQIPTDKESIVIFHETPEVPVVSRTSSTLGRPILDTVLMQNSRLAVPRILNPVRFLDICPADGLLPSSPMSSAAEARSDDGHDGHRHLCLILLLHHRDGLVEGTKHRAWFDLFRTALSPAVPPALASSLGLASRLPVGFIPILSPAHLYADRQREWLLNLTASSTCPACLDPISDVPGYVLALWRISSRAVAFRLLPRHSNLHPAEILPHNTIVDKEVAEAYTDRLKTAIADLVLDMVEVTDYLRSRDPDTLDRDVHGWSLGYLPRMEALLRDELTSPLWLRIKRKLWKMCSCLVVYYDEFTADPIDFILTSRVVFVVLCLCVAGRVGTDVWAEFTRPPAPSATPVPQSRSTSPPSVQFKAAPLGVTLVTPSTYSRLISDAPRGQITAVLCTDNSSLGQRLTNRFLSICNRVGISSGCQLVPASLHVDCHPEWLGWALEAATRIPIRPRGTADDALSFNPSNCRGTIFVVNCYRHYFHMYHPLLPGSRPQNLDVRKDVEEGEEGIVTRNRQTASRRYANFSRLLGLNLSDESDVSDFDSSDSNAAIKSPLPALMEHELLAGLVDWFDRLFDGSIRRYQVSEWPRHLKLSD